MHSPYRTVPALTVLVLNYVTLGSARASSLDSSPPSAPAIVEPSGRIFSIRRPLPRTKDVALTPPVTLLGVSFDDASVTGFVSNGAACLTAGTTATPATSIPACGPAAPVDLSGFGALQLTPAEANVTGFVVSTAPIATSAGLVVTFTDYSFGGTSRGADGLLFFLTDASKALPVAPGAADYALGYARVGSERGLAHGYLGIGFDEAGNFSNFNLGLTGGWGAVPNSVVVRGAAATQYTFLAATRNSFGYPAGLPLRLDAPEARMRPVAAPTIRIMLTPAGILSVAIDAHDGHGFLEDIPPTKIVGSAGANVLAPIAQPPVPPSVYLGFAATTSPWGNERHQIAGLTVMTLPTSLRSDVAAADGPGVQRLFGVVESLAGTRLVLRLRGGVSQVVDGTTAFATGFVAKPLVRGNPVIVNGRFRAGGTFAAMSISRVPPAPRAQTSAERYVRVSTGTRTATGKAASVRATSSVTTPPSLRDSTSAPVKRSM